MKARTFDYDGTSDSLFISIKNENEKISGSAEIGNIVLDFTNEGKIASIEVLGISRFLDMIKVNKNILNELTGSELIIQKNRDSVSIFIVLKTSKIEQSISLATIPVMQPLASSI